MSVEVICGVNRLDGQYDNKTVADLRSLLTAALNIPADAIVYVNDERASGTQIVNDGDSVEFVRNAGTKGN